MATIQKRKDAYRIRVSCGYDSGGKHIVQSTTWAPETGMTEKQIAKELNRVSVEFESKVKDGYFISEAKTRLSDFCPQYLENVQGRLSPLTYQSYKQLIDTYITPALGHMKLKDIRPQHIQSFIKNLQEDNVRTDGKPGKLSPATIKRIYSVLQAVLHNACKLELISVNPANKEKIELPTVQPAKVDIFTKEEAAALLGCLSKEPLMHQALINLAIVTGCRRGELVALEWPDIDFKAGTVSISKSNYKLKGEEIKTKQPKTTGSVRMLTIPQFMIDMLKDYQMEQKLTRLKLGNQWQGGDWMFTQWNGEPMNPMTPTEWFDSFLKRYDLPHRKFHALRHTSATLLLTNGTNIKEVGSRLGHHKLSTTNRYVHEVASADAAAAQAFEDMFAPSKKA